MGREIELPMDEILNEQFMQQHTDFESLSEFFDASPWPVPGDKSIEDVPRDDLDDYVDAETKFDDFDEMHTAGWKDRISD